MCTGAHTHMNVHIYVHIPYTHTLNTKEFKDSFGYMVDFRLARAT